MDAFMIHIWWHAFGGHVYLHRSIECCEFCDCGSSSEAGDPGHKPGGVTQLQTPNYLACAWLFTRQARVTCFSVMMPGCNAERLDLIQSHSHSPYVAAIMHRTY
jgi:hypothetical protein